MSAAQEAVISTPELLELILSYLPMRQLLVTAPLVSKTWHALTLTPTLQRALFFQPDPTVSTPVQNPLLVEIFPPFFAPEGPSHSSSSIVSMPWSKAPDAFKRVEASWRRMLVTQPSAKTMIVEERRYGRRASPAERQGVLVDSSLRMGVLYDVAVPFVGPASSFRIRWHNGVDRKVDLTLSVFSTVTSVRRPSRKLDERFDSDGRKEVKIDFGEWVQWGHAS